MAVEVFVDESGRRPNYLLVATKVDSRQLKDTRTAMRRMLMPGERSVHMATEKVPRRRIILDAVARLEVQTSVFVCKAAEKVARPLLLGSLVPAVSEALVRLVIESRSQDDAYDREVLIELQRSGSFPDTAAYEHLQRHEEPLLWISDAVAWAWGAGGEWRRKVEPVVTNVEHIDP